MARYSTKTLNLHAISGPQPPRTPWFVAAQALLQKPLSSSPLLLFSETPHTLQYFIAQPQGEALSTQLGPNMSTSNTATHTLRPASSNFSEDIRPGLTSLGAWAAHCCNYCCWAALNTKAPPHTLEATHAAWQHSSTMNPRGGLAEPIHH